MSTLFAQRRAFAPSVLFEPDYSYLQPDELILKLILMKDSHKRYFFSSYYLLKDLPATEVLLSLIDLYEDPKIEFNPPLDERLKEKLLTEHPSLDNLIRENVVFIIKWWISKFLDFYDFPELVTILEKYVQEKQNKLQATIISQLALFRAAIPIFVSKKPHRYETSFTPSNFSFLSSKYLPETIVQQVTLYEYEIISHIRLREFMNHNFTNQNSGSNPNPNPNLSNYLSHFKRLRAALIQELLSAESRSQTATLIKRAIKLASLCIDQHNYNFAMEILSALYASEMFTKDKIKAWESLDGNIFSRFQEICTLLSPDDNYLLYKSALSSSKSFIPFLGVHIGDIRFIDEFNKTISINGVNEKKLALLWREFNKFKLFPGREHFGFEVDSDFQQKLAAHLDYVDIGVPSKKAKKLKIKVTDEESRLAYLRQRYENFYNDAIVTGREEFNYSDHKMRRRDWSIITSNSTTLNFSKGELIDFPSHEHIYLLMEGTVVIEKEGVEVRMAKGPIILNYNHLLDIPSPLIYYAASNCEVFVMEKVLLFSILRSNSDPLLSVRFFVLVANSLIEILKCSNVKDYNPRRRYQSPLTNRAVLLRHITYNVSNSALETTVKRDEELRSIFQWKKDEIVIKECKASMVGAIDIPGTLFITKNYVCFYAKIFSHKSKFSLEIDKINSIRVIKQKLIIENERKRKNVFKIMSELEDTQRLIEKLLSSVKESGYERTPLKDSKDLRKSLSDSRDSETNIDNSLPSFELTTADWKVLLRGAKKMTFKKDDVLIHEGDASQRIFQLTRGSCRIQSNVGGLYNEIGTIRLGEIFGEISFTQKKGASVSVIADSDVEVFAIEGSYLKRLFHMRPELAGKFMQYICCVVGKRLGIRFFETQEEREVFDIIVPPIYSTIDKVNIAKLANPNLLHSFSGPLTDVKEELQNFTSTARDFGAASTISTYPMRVIDISETERLTIQDGSPICDQYKANIYSNRIIASVADGCNWGEAPREAAQKARDAFVGYLSNHMDVMLNTQCVASLVQRAFSLAHAAILKNKDSSIEMVGTTTLIGGVLVELEAHDQPDSPPVENASNNNWALVYGSLGDCKIFHWSSQTSQFFDVTKNNRNLSLSASDCGGRLGPHMPGDMPDLRNFEIGFYPCNANDLMIFVSDGVHDNLDPHSLGFEPCDLGHPESDWDQIPDLNRSENIKTDFRLFVLEKFIFKEFDLKTVAQEFCARPATSSSRPLPPPSEIVQNLLDHCKQICFASTEFMEKRPNDKLPTDYKLYPGKMDHTTALCIRIAPNHDS